MEHCYVESLWLFCIQFNSTLHIKCVILFLLHLHPFFLDIDFSAGYSSIGILRGVRIRNEHRRNFPALLVGFGGGILVSNMVQREDCLITIQKVVLNVSCMEGQY